MNTIDQCQVPTPTGTLLFNDGFGPRCGKVFPCPDHPPKWGEQHWQRMHPIDYKPGEMEAGVLPEKLIEDLRSDLSRIRGKLGDIRRGYGWTDRIEAPEHGITLVIIALYNVVEEMVKSRKKEPL